MRSYIISIFETYKIKLKSKKDDLLLFIIDLLLVLFAYSAFLNFTLSSDNLSAFTEVGTKNLGVIDYCYGGRYTIFFFCKLLDIIGFDYLKGQIYSQLFKILVTTFCIFGYSKNIFSGVQRCRNQNASFIIVNMTILFSLINVFYVETFVYTTPDWGIGLFFAYLTFLMFLKDKFILSFIFAFLTVSEYQVYLIIAGCAIITYILLSDSMQINKRSIIKYIKLLFVTGAAALINILLPIILSTTGILSRASKDVSIGKEINILERIAQIAEMVKCVFRDAKGMMPNKMIFWYFATLIVTLIIGVIRYPKKSLNKFNCGIIIGILLIMPFGIGLITAGFYMPARVLFPFFFSLSMIAVIIYSCTESSLMRSIFVIITTCFCIVCIWNTRLASVDHYTSNILDFQYAKEIQEKIEGYERETGNVVEIVKYVEWEERIKTWDYREFMYLNYYDTNYNIKLVYDDWGIVSLLKFVSGRDYESDIMTLEEYNTYFGNYSWDYINLEQQIKFNDNIMYWAVY